MGCPDCHQWYEGDAIKIKHNGNTIATIPRGFNEFEHCLSLDDVDVTNDEFQLQSTGNDGVCITSLTINDNLLLVGENNNSQNFWVDGDDTYCPGDFMITSQITIRNGQVISSTCKGTLYIIAHYWVHGSIYVSNVCFESKYYHI